MQVETGILSVALRQLWSGFDLLNAGVERKRSIKEHYNQKTCISFPSGAEMSI